MLQRGSRPEHPVSQLEAVTHFIAVLIPHGLTSYGHSAPQCFHLRSQAVGEMQIYYFSVLLVC